MSQRRPYIHRGSIPFAARLALVMAMGACKLHGSAPTDAGSDASANATSFVESAVARAEDARRAKDVPAAVQTSHDVVARRRSARALARIADGDSVDGLVNHLADDDAEVVTWAAYGLGYTCKGREEAHVRLLAARGASLPTTASTRPASVRGALELDPYFAIARAIGRCASPMAEQVLVSFLTSAERAHSEWLEPATIGLGDLATRRKHLGANAMTALLDMAGDKASPRDFALYPLGRAEPGEAFAGRVAEVALAALGRPGEFRILAIRALARVSKEDARDVASTLGRVVADAKSFGAGERAEAARALGGLGGPGQAAIASAIANLTPDAKDPIAIANLTGPSFHALYTLLGQLGPEAPKQAEPSLAVLASLTPPTQPKPGLARRIAELRCSAALALARGAYEADDLKKCDAESSEISQRARLASLLRRPLTRDRLAAFRAFAKSEHLRVREDAVEAIASHPELGEAGAAVLADALTSKHAGLVATAADTIRAHPERVMVLAASEKRAGLDPKSPPPTANPARELAPAVARALGAALTANWPEDRYETKIALVAAAASVHHPQAIDAATRACKDPNPVVRERALKALRTTSSSITACDTRESDPTHAPELDATLTKPTKVVLTTDVGELSIVLEPELSPVTATRIASLVKSGFYKGIVVHRVVPGFVVQLGDPDGDGYGGSGTSLRCETSPVPFGRLDVGMALAGRDTGSSQFFVTLSRTPHLDGEYTRVGHAEGDWESVAQGDVITDARIVE